MYLSPSNIGNIYVMYIHLPGTHYDVKIFHPEDFLSEQSLQFCQYFVFAGLFLDDIQLLCSTSPGCLYRLHVDRLFLVYQQGFLLSAGSFRKIWELYLPEFQVASACQFWAQVYGRTKPELSTTTAKWALYRP